MSRTPYTGGFVGRVRTLIAGFLVAGALLVPLSVATPEAGALSNSAFCQAVFTWAKHPIPSPSRITISTYHTWVKDILPYYERMQATAPNAKTKEVLSFVVTVLKAYGRDSNLRALGAYEKLHAKQFASDVRVMAESIVGCATSGVIKLP